MVISAWGEHYVSLFLANAFWEKCKSAAPHFTATVDQLVAYARDLRGVPAHNVDGAASYQVTHQQPDTTCVNVDLRRIDGCLVCELQSHPRYSKLIPGVDMPRVRRSASSRHKTLLRTCHLKRNAWYIGS